MNLILKVKEPLEKSSNSPWCIAWIILLLLSSKSSQKREKPGILWFLVAHLTPSEAHLTAVMCPAISGLSRRMPNTSLMSWVLNAPEVSLSSRFKKGFKIVIAMELPLPIQPSGQVPQTPSWCSKVFYTATKTHIYAEIKQLKKPTKTKKAPNQMKQTKPTVFSKTKKDQIFKFCTSTKSGVEINE